MFRFQSSWNLPANPSSHTTSGNSTPILDNPTSRRISIPNCINGHHLVNFPWRRAKFQVPLEGLTWDHGRVIYDDLMCSGIPISRSMVFEASFQLFVSSNRRACDLDRLIHARNAFSSEGKVSSQDFLSRPSLLLTHYYIVSRLCQRCNRLLPHLRLGKSRNPVTANSISFLAPSATDPLLNCMHVLRCVCGFQKVVWPLISLL